MSEIFLQIFNMSVSASYILLAVLLLRLLLRKAPKWIRVFLWGIAALRLVCPFSIESAVSLIPSAEVVSPSIMTDSAPTLNTGIPIINNAVNPIIGGTFTPDPGNSANPLQVWIPILTAVWLTGIAALLIYTAVSFVRVKRRIGTAVLCHDNIYQSESVVSPFVLGILKPRIYLPFNMSGQDMVHVIAHENAHIRRKDHLWKPLGFLLLTLHWFNPMMWLGYVLLCRDIELACDEKVIRELDRDARADYSEALLTCGVNRRMISACPLAFGEVSVKSRVKSVLNYKKPAFWIIIAAVASCIVVAVCFLTDPLSKEEPDGTSSSGETTQNDETTQNQEEAIGSADNSESYNNTEYEGVYMTCVSFGTTWGAGIPTTTIVWHNETDKEITYGYPCMIEVEQDGKWVVIKSYDENYNHPLGYLLNPHETQTEKYNIPIPSYQFFNNPVRITVPFSVKEGDSYVSYKASVVIGFYSVNTIRSLRTQYPDFFGLNTDGGLTVYIWQLSKNNYKCYLVSTATDRLTDHGYAFPYGVSMPEMRHILSTYDIEKENVKLRPIKNPISSYDYTIDNEYRQRVQSEFWSNYYNTAYSYTQYDVANIDIDNDGINETCILSGGPTSGIFTFRFSVYESGAVNCKYNTVFEFYASYLSFEKGSDGVTKVKAKTMDKNPKTYLLDISIKDDNIALSKNGEPLKSVKLTDKE